MLECPHCKKEWIEEDPSTLANFLAHQIIIHGDEVD